MKTFIFSLLAVIAPIEGEETEIIDQGISAYDVFGILVVIVVIIGALLLLKKLFSGVDDLESGANVAESYFIEALIDEAHGVTPEGGPAQLFEAPANPRKPSQSAPGQSAPSDILDEMPSRGSGVNKLSGSGVFKVPEGVNGVEALAKKLFALRVVLDAQGKIPLPLPPEGLIYTLRKGGTCAILPRMENSELMEHFAKRFNVLFVLMPGGEVVVLERMQSRVSEMASDTMNRKIM